MPSRQMRLVTHLKEGEEKKKRKSRQKCEWRTGRTTWGEGGRKEKEGVVASCNEFNLNPKLTRCRDCRVLKIWRNYQRQHGGGEKKKIKHRLLFLLRSSLASDFTQTRALSSCVSLQHTHTHGNKKKFFRRASKDKQDTHREIKSCMVHILWQEMCNSQQRAGELHAAAVCCIVQGNWNKNSRATHSKLYKVRCCTNKTPLRINKGERVGTLKRWAWNIIFGINKLSLWWRLWGADLFSFICRRIKAI